MNIGLDYVNKHRKKKQKWKPTPTPQEIQNQSDHRRKLANEAVRRKRSENKIKVQSYFTTHPCFVCKEHDVDCLEFHHLNPNEKEYNVSELLTYSWTKVKLEIEKCVVLCANCHRKEHARFRRNEQSLLVEYEKGR